MRINGHTRLDLYSSCTAVQVTLKNSHSYTGSPLKKLKFQLTYFPGLYGLAVWTKTQLSRWESMDIPDLTCTVLVRPYRWPWRIHIAIQDLFEKTQIPVNILPRTVQTSRLDQNAALRMGINGHTRLDLYSSCTAGQVTLKNFPLLIYRISIEKTQIRIKILPRTVRNSRWTKT